MKKYSAFVIPRISIIYLYVYMYIYNIIFLLSGKKSVAKVEVNMGENVKKANLTFLEGQDINQTIVKFLQQHKAPRSKTGALFEALKSRITKPRMPLLTCKEDGVNEHLNATSQRSLRLSFNIGAPDTFELISVVYEGEQHELLRLCSDFSELDRLSPESAPRALYSKVVELLGPANFTIPVKMWKARSVTRTRIRAIVDCKPFKDADVSAADLANNIIKNMTLSELKKCGYSIKDLKVAFHSSLEKFREAGVDVVELTNENDFSVSQLLQEGFDVSQIYDKCLIQSQTGTSKEKQLFDAGFSIHKLREVIKNKSINTTNDCFKEQPINYCLYKPPFNFSLANLKILDNDRIKFEEDNLYLADIFNESINVLNRPLMDLKSKGYNCSDLYNEWHNLHNLHNLKKALAEEFRKIGCTVLQLAKSPVIENSPLELIYNHNFTYFEVYEAGYSLEKLEPKNAEKLEKSAPKNAEKWLNLSDLKKLLSKDPLPKENLAKLFKKLYEKGIGGFDARSLKNLIPEIYHKDMIQHLGFDLDTLHASGYSLVELKATGVFNISHFTQAGHKNWADLASAGFSIADLYKSNEFDVPYMKGHGVKLIDLYDMLIKEIKEHDATILKLSEHYKIEDFRDNNFELASLINVTINGGYKYKLKDFLAVNYTALELSAAGVSLKRYTDEGFKLGHLHRLNNELFSIENLGLFDAKMDRFKREKFDLALIKFFYEKDTMLTLQDIRKDGKYSCEEFKSHGFSLSEMKMAGFTMREIKNSRPHYYLRDFKDSGAFTLLEICASRLFITPDITKEFPDIKLLRDAKCL